MNGHLLLVRQVKYYITGTLTQSIARLFETAVNSLSKGAFTKEIDNS